VWVWAWVRCGAARVGSETRLLRETERGRKIESMCVQCWTSSRDTRDKSSISEVQHPVLEWISNMQDASTPAWH
jgi:hypothetical protein